MNEVFSRLFGLDEADIAVDSQLDQISERLAAFTLPSVNCSVTVSGKHCFYDRMFYSNFYGLSLFSSPEQYVQNPYATGMYKYVPGVIESLFYDDGIPRNERPFEFGTTESERKILKVMDGKYAKKLKPNDVFSEFSYICDGFLSEENNSLTLRYGEAAPNTVCVTDDAATALLSFSPFPSLAFKKDEHVAQTMYRCLPAESPLSPPEEILIDFSVYTKRFSNTLSMSLCGALDLSYIISVGTTRCEISELHIEISPKGGDKAESSQAEKQG